MIKPTHDNILVDPIKPNDKTKSGIIITEKKEDAVSRGRVIDFGPQIDFLKKRDIVIFSMYSSQLIQEEKDYFIVKGDGILGIYDNGTRPTKTTRNIQKKRTNSNIG